MRIIPCIKDYPNDNWTRTEIFRIAYGRLPTKQSDSITKETLALFHKKVMKLGRKASMYHRSLVFQINSGWVLTSKQLVKKRNESK